jgi:aminoglycoside phosphotransferase (APT) family kinase protein
MLRTTYSTIEWSTDRTRVTKTRVRGPDARRRFRNELRVNRALRASPPPVATPALLEFDVQRRRLTFEAFAGEPIGPKYPAELATTDLDAIIDLVAELAPYRPRSRLRGFDALARVRFAQRTGLLDARAARALEPIARRHRRLAFAHGDVTARNVLRAGDGHALIDWEWAGRYPAGYDLGFLWFSVRHVAGAREHIERTTTIAPESLLFCALLVELWHLQWYVPAEFFASHLAERDALIARLIG